MWKTLLYKITQINFFLGHPFIMTVGIVAGDEESYDTFKDLMDPIIEARHGGYKADAKHPTDLDFTKITGGEDLDPAYVLSSRVRTGRSIRGIALPPHCTRAERRKVGLRHLYEKIRSIGFCLNV